MKNVRSRQLITVVFWTLVISVFLYSNMQAKTAKEIDAGADAAVERFYKQVNGAGGFAQNSKAMLVMPNVFKGAFVVGGEYGEGALRISGKTVDYYSLISGSFGFQIGG